MKYLFIYLTAFCTLTIQAQRDLKRIIFLESNNHLLNQQYKILLLDESINTPDAVELKKYTLENGLKNNSNDMVLILEALKWVSSQWEHDGRKSANDLSALEILQNAKSGSRYRCVEYGRVLARVLQSFGFLSRGINMTSPKAPYGPTGSGHFATEVWSDDLGKWIFLDPQFCIYAKYKGEFLNYYEISQLEKNGMYDDIDFIMSEGYLGYKAFGGRQTEAEHVNYYKNYIKNYFGSLMTKVKVNNKEIQMVLLLKTAKQFLTFQGFPKGNTIFTDKPHEFYFPLNQNSIVFEFTDPQKHFEKYNALMKEGVITNSKSQFDNMGLYAATPDLIMHHNHNMPFFSYYQVYLNDQLVPVNKDGTFNVSLKEGSNIISSYAINKNGKKGSETQIKIFYGNQ